MKPVKSHILVYALTLALALPCMALAGAPSSFGSVVFSQPITITSGVGFGGADVSSIPVSGYGALGYTAARNPSGGYFTVADDFKLDETTALTGAAFYILQYDEAPPATIAGAYAVIYDNSPALGGSIIWGDMLDNILYDVESLNLYRVYETDLLNKNYPMSIVYLSMDVTLEPGTYWIAFITDANSYYGPYVPLTFAYQTPDILNFNVLQDRSYYGGTWANISSDGEFEPSALIFDLYGAAVPATGDPIVTRLYIPALLTVLTGGILVLLIIRRNRYSRNH